MGKIFSFIFGVILIAAGAFLVYGNSDIGINNPDTTNLEDENVNTVITFNAPETFTAQVDGEIDANTTSVSAARTPEFLLQLYPNLTVGDFENVEASGGHYVTLDGEIAFIPSNKNNEKNPGARIISDHGMETLLINIISRTGKVIDSQETLTDLFVFLKDDYDNVELSSNIEVTSPIMNELVTSPLTITGRAKDFFQKGEFDVALYDDQNILMATSTAKATTTVESDEFVPFTSTILFNPKNALTGKILLTPRTEETSAPARSFEVLVRFK